MCLSEVSYKGAPIRVHLNLGDCIPPQREKELPAMPKLSDRGTDSLVRVRRMHHGLPVLHGERTIEVASGDNDRDCVKPDLLKARYRIEAFVPQHVSSLIG